MRLFKLAIFSFFTNVLAQSADLSSLLAQWSEIAPTITNPISLPNVVPTRLGNVDPPPTSLMLAIFTGVPQDVLVDLINPIGRASIASEFGAGNTPEWYQALPTPLKSYLESIHAAIKTGGNDYTGTEAPPEIPNFTATVGPLASGIPDGDGEGNVEPASSTAGAQPMATWGAMEVMGVTGVVGILGLAVGL
ncbi:hypothetical protein BS50DRAFT_647297 [Corynespora cassiicola Philippines]|uniref:Uncharacterized protein n=1 Tax=Corynespora cassiicola Philippines TaxID=1448308 RepID=A0A2T2NF35_CORCC|nr:hypothetical protein BS50DRAFT_647297 [Corynespora cassiicola Philippines]